MEEWSLLGAAILGGSMIGLAATLLLLFSGRVAGISGILGTSLAKPSQFNAWALTFLVGLMTGGVIIFRINPDLFANRSDRGSISLLLAGLLVGYGTALGSGCTSGHGVCGLSRLSLRSLVATLTFMIFGFAMVSAMRALFGGV